MSVQRFRGFDIYPNERRVVVGGVPVKIGARAFDVLLALVAGQGALLRKNELLDAAWPHVHVEENNLTVQIAALRKVLGDQAISTTPGRGYRFTAPSLDPDDGDTHSTASGLERAVAPNDGRSPRSLPPGWDLPLIGRDDELASLSTLLAAHRLITITGAGGIGKTRLARELLLQVEATGVPVTWIELAGLSEPALVAGSMAAALGVSARDPLRGLVAALRGAAQFIVVDNAEHLADAVASVLAILLQEVPGVRLLVTSQAPLRLTGERVYRLGALAGPEGPVSADEARTFGAVALFAERAAQAERRFVLDEGNVADVVALCAQLDGIPLAIELAAARVPLLGVAALARSLDQRLSLLNLGRRGAPQRQATLRGALSWSHDLLSESEQVVFRRLSVFAGAFTLEEARYTASSSTEDTPLSGGAWDVVDALGVLTDRSLVAVDGNTTPSYRLLESARVLAREKLGSAGEVERTTRRLVRCLIARLDPSTAEEMRLSAEKWIAEYDVDISNLRSALDFCFDGDRDVSLGLALVARSGRLWLNRSLQPEGLARLVAASGKIDANTPSHDVHLLWRGIGNLLVNSDPARALAAYEHARAALGAEADSASSAELALHKSRSLAGLGRLAEAQEALDEAFPVLRQAGFPRPLAQHAMSGAFIAKVGGHLDKARQRYEQALLLYRQCGDRSSSLGILNSLADTAWAQGDLDRARSNLEEAIESMRGERRIPKGRLGVCLTNLAGVCVELGDFEASLAAAREGIPLRIEAGYVWGALDPLALRAMLVGRARDAARIAGYADAVYLRRSAPRQPNEARARARLEQLIREQIAEDELARLRKEGEIMTEDAICALALAS